MKQLVSVESRGNAVVSWWRRRTATKALLVAGILAAALYTVGDLLSGLLYQGYRFKDQAISELTALGSPVRPLMLAVIIVYGLLGMGLGVGIWRSAGRNWSLRFVTVGLIATGAIGLVLHPFFPMSSRGLEGDFTFTNTMHQNLTMVWALIISVTVVLAAIAYRGWFRFYSLATLVLLIAGGIAASMAIQGIDQNNTPWAGAFERINAYSLNVWLAVLAVTVIRHPLNQVMLDGSAPSEAESRKRSRLAASS